jgi:hypothetical protein
MALAVAQGATLMERQDRASSAHTGGGWPA